MMNRIKVTPIEKGEPVWINTDKIFMISEENVNTKDGLSDGMGMPISQKKVVITTTMGTAMVVEEKLSDVLGVL